MDTIASMISGDHAIYFNRLWAEVFESTGLRSRFVDPVPHVSYVTGEFSDPDRLESKLREVANGLEAFTIRTAGLGLFTGVQPTLYVAVVRNPTLSCVQEIVMDAIDPVASEIKRVYDTINWTPHMTIGHDSNGDSMAQAVELLCMRDFNLELTIDNITVLYEDRARPIFRVPFRGK